MPCYLAIDQGTHASRAILFDDNGKALAQSEQTIDIARPAKGRVEQDAVQILASVRKVACDILKKHDQHNIVACGIAIQRSTVLAWNANGEALAPALSWQDVRAADVVAQLKSHEHDIQNITGLPLSAHYGAGKLYWLMTEVDEVVRSDPEQLRLSPLISYILFHICHQSPYIVDHSNAQRTQLMSLETLDWSAQLAHWFDVAIDYLPECVPVCYQYGTLLDSPVPVTAVCGDQNAAMFGAGELDHDTALVNIGTGAFVLRRLQQLTVSDRQLSGIAYSDADSVHYVREATINGAGSALSWLEQRYQIRNMFDRLPQWLLDIKQPPVFINTIGGLGSPWWRDSIETEFIGDDKTQAGRAVAVVESAVFMIMANLELIIKEGELTQLHVSGGLSRLDGLCQKLADLSGLPVLRIREPETTARGIAWLAAGRPQHWQTNSSDHFYPQTDSALSERYTLFTQELNNRLEQA